MRVYRQLVGGPQDGLWVRARPEAKFWTVAGETGLYVLDGWDDRTYEWVPVR